MSTFICAISGQPAEQPVVSPRSGDVFEKRLLTKFVEENGYDPITKEELSVSELVELKHDPTARPSHRSLATASLPSLMKTLQDEWDAAVLNSFVLQQELKTAREELTHALYQNDAACRVISRLSAELKSARAILASFPHGRGVDSAGVEGAASGGIEDEEMEDAEGGGLPGISEAVLQVLSDKAAELSSARKQRGKGLPEGLVGVEQMRAFEEVACHTGIHSTSIPGITALDLQKGMIVTGGADKTVVLFNAANETVEATFKGHQKRITGVILHPDQKTIVSSAADAQVRIWKANEEKVRHVVKVHTKGVSDISLHPTGDYVLCASEDANWSLVDLKSGRALTKAKSTDDETSLHCGQFHPDGLIFGTGGSSGVVKIWDLKEQTEVAQFPGYQAGVRSISFSENGYYLATGSEDGEVKIWDLRKLRNLKSLTLDSKAPINCMTFDYSGAYLAIGGRVVEVLQVKTWAPLVRFEGHTQPATGIRFGENVATIVSTSMDKSLRIYSSR